MAAEAEPSEPACLHRVSAVTGLGPGSGLDSASGPPASPALLHLLAQLAQELEGSADAGAIAAFRT